MSSSSNRDYFLPFQTLCLLLPFIAIALDRPFSGMLVSSPIPLRLENTLCIVSIILNLLRFYGPEDVLPWCLFHGHLERVCSLLLLERVSINVDYIPWMDGVNWVYQNLRSFFLVFRSVVKKKNTEGFNYNCKFFYCSSEFKQFLLHIFCSSIV